MAMTSLVMIIVILAILLVIGVPILGWTLKR